MSDHFVHAEAAVQQLIADTQSKATQFNSQFTQAGKLAKMEESDLKKRIVADKLSAVSGRFNQILEDFGSAQDESNRMLERALQHRRSVAGPADGCAEDGVREGLLVRQTQMFLTQMDPDTLALVQDREDGLKRVEEGMQQLRELMVNLAMLTAQQGEVVDTVERRIEDSSAWTGEAKLNLVKARKLRGRERKKKLMIFAVILGGIASLGAFFGLKIAAGTM